MTFYVLIKDLGKDRNTVVDDAKLEEISTFADKLGAGQLALVSLSVQ